MTKHILLTGEIQIGKTTALRTFLKNSGTSADGFATYFDTRETPRTLYLARFDYALGTRGAEPIARFSDGGSPPEVFSEVFDIHGVEILESCGKRELILLDELGNLEERSPRFKRAVLGILDGKKLVIGVVKLRESPFLNAVRAHPNVEVWTVTLENRGEIAGRLQMRFGK